MEQQHMVTATDFCAHHHIQLTFIKSLSDYGLIEIQNVDDEIYLLPDQLNKLEKIVDLHFRMEINLEGIETIEYLLTRIHSMQEEIAVLKNRLRFYE
ncbi:MAG: MerR family transcriptional regulator [Chitinophagaceae bacterium]|nr:MAG: MerR family transcriptional regulator [Chitinophagaceae bacterium]